LKFKITRPPSPEKLSEIAEEAKAEVEEKGKRGKKRKSESWTEAEGEVREAIGKGKGKKKVKVSHEEEEEPKKKNVAIVKKSSGGVGEKSATDMISDLFGDDDDEEEDVKEKKEVVKPVIKIKGKPGRKPKIEQEQARDVDGDVKMDRDEVVAEKVIKSSNPSGSKSRRTEQEEVKPEAEPTVASKSISKRTKRDTNDKVTIPDEPAAEPTIAASKSTSKRTKRDTTNEETIPIEPVTEISAAKAPKPKGRPKKTIEAEAPPTSTTVSTDKEKIPESASAPELDTGATKDAPKSTPAIEKPKKSFAQVVAGSPPPSEKREKKPLPTITKLAKPIGSTPDKRLLPGSGSGTGTGTNTPTAKKLPPPQKKKEVSLLESTMASLLGGGPKPTPKKEVSFILICKGVLTRRRRKHRNLLLNLLSKNAQKVLGLMSGFLPLLNSGKYWKVGKRGMRRGGRGCYIE